MPGEGRGIQFLPTPQCIIEAVEGPPIEQNANRDGCVYHQPRQLSALKEAWSIDENDSARLERMGRRAGDASRRQALHDAKDRGDSGHVLEVAWALIFGRNSRNLS
mmetsp:Transcript_25874/g.66761  ORF Transcript_25874/g.66761 Transcript_25874/m.66761 type:complete len:106 (-) Transcript_25874:103-420(-)